MTLDEAIESHEAMRELYNRMYEIANDEDSRNCYARCIEEHKQTAEWLSELKNFRINKRTTTQLPGDSVAEYHIGCGLMEIYAGILNEKRDEWIDKSIVTDEAFKAVVQYCVDHLKTMSVKYNGNKYRVDVTKIFDDKTCIVEWSD